MKLLNFFFIYNILNILLRQKNDIFQDILCAFLLLKLGQYLFMWYFSYITMTTFTSGWFWINQASVQKNDREHNRRSLPVSKKTKAGFSYGCGYWWIPTSDLKTQAVSRACVSGNSVIWGSILWTSTTHSELGRLWGKVSLLCMKASVYYAGRRANGEQEVSQDPAEPL